MSAKRADDPLAGPTYRNGVGAGKAPTSSRYSWRFTYPSLSESSLKSAAELGFSPCASSQLFGMPSPSVSQLPLRLVDAWVITPFSSAGSGAVAATPPTGLVLLSTLLTTRASTGSRDHQKLPA